MFSDVKPQNVRPAHWFCFESLLQVDHHHQPSEGEAGRSERKKRGKGGRGGREGQKPRRGRQEEGEGGEEQEGGVCRSRRRRGVREAEVESQSAGEREAGADGEPQPGGERLSQLTVRSSAPPRVSCGNKMDVDSQTC